MADNAVAQAIDNIRLKSQGTDCLTTCAVTINFHPDRYTSDNKPLLEAMAEDSCILSSLHQSLISVFIEFFPVWHYPMRHRSHCISILVFEKLVCSMNMQRKMANTSVQCGWKRL